MLVGDVQPVPGYLHISQISVVTHLCRLFPRDWKIEAVGSISTNCWLALRRKFMTIAFESLQNKFQ